MACTEKTMNLRNRLAAPARHGGAWLAALALAACATGLDVRVQDDAKADFTRYRTFAFARAETPPAGAVADPLVRTRIETLIRSELADRKLAPAASPDLLVIYTGGVKERERVFMEGPGGGWQGYGWRQDLGSGGATAHDYRQANLVIDLIDARSKQLVWRASIAGAITEGYSETNWTRLAQAINEAFKSFPPARR
jgi:hypothetical protein